MCDEGFWHEDLSGCEELFVPVLFRHFQFRLDGRGFEKWVES